MRVVRLEMQRVSGDNDCATTNVLIISSVEKHSFHKMSNTRQCKDTCLSFLQQRYCNVEVHDWVRTSLIPLLAAVEHNMGYTSFPIKLRHATPTINNSHVRSTLRNHFEECSKNYLWNHDIKLLTNMAVKDWLSYYIATQYHSSNIVGQK